MPQSVHKLAGRLLIAAIFMAVVLAVSVLVRSSVPAAWRQTHWSVSATGATMFTAADGATGYVDYNYFFRPTDENGVETGVDVTVQLSAKDSAGHGVPLSVEAMDAPRTGFVNTCRGYTSIAPAVASSFDAVIASGGGAKSNVPAVKLSAGPYRVDLPERHAAAVRFFWADLTGKAALIALGVCGTAGLVWLLPRWTKERQRARIGRCVQCGYDLAGLVGGVCPECGSRGGAR